MELGESPDLFEESKELLEPRMPSVAPKLTSSSASKAARMLTYDSEDPLLCCPAPKSILKTPVKGNRGGSEHMVLPSKSACLLTDLDLAIENESASMVAFALSTPTKDDPIDFHQAFHGI